MNEHIKEPISCTLPAEAKSEIVFMPDKKEWVMKLTKEGIFFNRERYPNSKPDDFAQCVIDILEQQFTVEFKRKKPPYDKM